MISICWPSNPGSGSTKDTALIQCVDGWDPQIHELLCLGLDHVSRKVHPTAQVEVVLGTFVDFVTNYLAENGRRIHIIGQLYVNNSVQFWSVTNQGRGIGFLSICNLQDPVEATGW